LLGCEIENDEIIGMDFSVGNIGTRVEGVGEEGSRGKEMIERMLNYLEI